MADTDKQEGLGQRFDQVADDVPQILWSVDADGQHDYVNRELKEFVGERISSVDADSWTTLIHPDDRARRATPERSSGLDRTL